MANKTLKDGKMARSKAHALPILASTANYSEAARLIGVNVDQVYKWLLDEDFRREVEKLRNRILDDAISKMKGSVSKAVETLVQLMDDESASVRRAASNDILNHVAKFVELKELATRIQALEERV